MLEGDLRVSEGFNANLTVASLWKLRFSGQLPRCRAAFVSAYLYEKLPHQLVAFIIFSQSASSQSCAARNLIPQFARPLGVFKKNKDITAFLNLSILRDDLLSHII